MTSPLRVLLVAEEGAGLQALKLVRRLGCNLVGLVTSTGTPGGKSAIRAGAADVGCPMWEPSGVARPEVVAAMAALDVDILLNVHSLLILPAEVVTVPRFGSFNLHPGPLPTYAGLSVPSWAIYRGETEHAVTVHWMVPAIDAGDIAYETRIPILPDETGLSLSIKCIREGLPLLEGVLETTRSSPESIPARPQDLSQRAYYRRGAPKKGRVDWSASAIEIERLLRAANYRPFPSPWGTPWTLSGASRLGIVAARDTGVTASETPGVVGASTETGVLVATGTHWLEIERLEENGHVAPAKAILRKGQRLGPGDRGSDSRAGT